MGGRTGGRTGGRVPRDGMTGLLDEVVGCTTDIAGCGRTSRNKILNYYLIKSINDIRIPFFNKATKTTELLWLEEFLLGHSSYYGGF